MLLEQIYRSFKILNNETTLAELASYAEACGEAKLPESGRQEYLESVVNDILFNGTLVD